MFDYYDDAFDYFMMFVLTAAIFLVFILAISSIADNRTQVKVLTGYEFSPNQCTMVKEGTSEPIYTCVGEANEHYTWHNAR